MFCFIFEDVVMSLVLIGDGPNKNIRVFQVMGLKILSRVGTHLFFFWKKI